MVKLILFAAWLAAATDDERRPCAIDLENEDEVEAVCRPAA